MEQECSHKLTTGGPFSDWGRGIKGERTRFGVGFSKKDGKCNLKVSLFDWNIVKILQPISIFKSSFLS